jgi:GNAT superfamily N-acetyltransferase
MTTTEVEISLFDPHAATDAAWIAFNTFKNAALAELLPDDPPRTVEQRQVDLRNIPPVFHVRHWLAWDADHRALLGVAALILIEMEENRHVAQFELDVLPAYRRRGLGSRLLGLLADQAQAANRRVMITETPGAVPAGDAFLAHVGAHLALESHVNQLDLSQLDRDLLHTWQSDARHGGFTLGLWEGPYPEADLDAIVELVKSANYAPRGDLDVNDFEWTAEHLREQEASRQARSVERWTMYVRETATGDLAGYTEVFWDPGKPALLEQGFTAVWPRYRGHALGRWLKAAMLDKVLRERPQVRYVRTENADSNAAMLKINTDLGFRPYQSDNVWQIEVERVKEYLATRAGAAG